MFCGANGCTREHVWPTWLLRRFRSDNARIFSERRDHAPKDWLAGNTGLVVRRICASCNNGWMSTLEHKTKPLVESILSEKIHILEPAELASLAQWTTMKAMALEAVESEHRWFYLQEERELLHTSDTIPQRTTVLIAKVVSQPDIYSSAGNCATTAADGAFCAHVTTIAFGSLALQAVTIRVPPSVPSHVPLTYDVSAGPWESILVQIWPYRAEPVSWPPKQGLQGHIGLLALAERLNPPG